MGLNAVTGKLLWQYADPGTSQLLAGDRRPPAHESWPSGPPRRLPRAGAAHRKRPVQVPDRKLHHRFAGRSGRQPPDRLRGRLSLRLRARGGNGTAPTTAVTSPAAGSTVTNPDGQFTISGTASATHGVAAVDVEVQTPLRNSGPWFNWPAVLPRRAWPSTTRSWPPRAKARHGR